MAIILVAAIWRPLQNPAGSLHAMSHGSRNRNVRLLTARYRPERRRSNRHDDDRREHELKTNLDDDLHPIREPTASPSSRRTSMMT